jgi:hypothetical protein
MVTIRKWPRDIANDHADLFALETPEQIAQSLKRLAETSQCRDGSAYDRAVAILSDHIAHDGAILSSQQMLVLDEARERLRELFMVRG